MVFLRSEEHLERWLAGTGRDHGATLTAGQLNELAVAHLELEALTAIRAGTLDAPVDVEGGRDAERVPGAVPEPVPPGGEDAMRRLDGGERIQHPDPRPAGLEHERMGSVQAPKALGGLLLADSERCAHVSGGGNTSVADEGAVDVIANTKIQLVHGPSIPLKERQ